MTGLMEFLSGRSSTPRQVIGVFVSAYVILMVVRRILDGDWPSPLFFLATAVVYALGAAWCSQVVRSRRPPDDRRPT